MLNESSIFVKRTPRYLNSLIVSISSPTILNDTGQYNDVFLNGTFFKFTCISIVDAQPNLSLLSV